MRKYLRLYFLIATVFCVAMVSGQQKLKIGHINSQELLAAMPASDSAQKKLEKIANEHEAILDEMTVEFNKKLDTYRKALDAGTLSDLAKSTKEGELQDLQNRIQTFQQTAQDDLQQKRVELFQPVQDAALKAVNTVAEENGFTYIFDTGMGAVVYSSPDAIDILPLVKAKLGLK
jgi:outer membrane protein